MELMPRVDPILQRIRLHDDLATVEAARCPGCGAAIRVDFWPDGAYSQVRCEGRILHLSVLQEIDGSPALVDRTGRRTGGIDQYSLRRRALPRSLKFRPPRHQKPKCRKLRKVQISTKRCKCVLSISAR